MDPVSIFIYECVIFRLKVMFRECFYNVNMFKKGIDKMVYAGLDVGSTTIKLVILNENKEVVYKRYERHFSNIKKTIHMFLSDVVKEYNDVPIKLTVTGSGGLSFSKWLEVPFIQEVIACVKAVEETIEGTDVVIELGGEDAKITFFTNGIEQRMNGTCAGGTGAFIDQMAALMNTDAAGLNDFFLYTLKNSMVKADLIGYHKKMKPISNLIIKYMERVRKNINKYLSISEHFTAYHNIHQIADGAKDILSLGNQTGEGWFLTGEMVSLIKDEVPNIICMQPFACLPNHVVGKGMIKALRNEYHEANIVAIDYDPGASSVNQLNRIKLMMAVAHKNLDSN